VYPGIFLKEEPLSNFVSARAIAAIELLVSRRDFNSKNLEDRELTFRKFKVLEKVGGLIAVGR
jgi:hypothetical protein